MGKSGPNAIFNLFFLGWLSWPWVGEFVGYIIIFTCFPTQQNVVHRKQPNITADLFHNREGANAERCVYGKIETRSSQRRHFRCVLFNITRPPSFGETRETLLAPHSRFGGQIAWN